MILIECQTFPIEIGLQLSRAFPVGKLARMRGRGEGKGEEVEQNFAGLGWVVLLRYYLWGGGQSWRKLS